MGTGNCTQNRSAHRPAGMLLSYIVRGSSVVLRGDRGRFTIWATVGGRPCAPVNGNGGIATRHGTRHAVAA